MLLRIPGVLDLGLLDDGLLVGRKQLHGTRARAEVHEAEPHEAEREREALHVADGEDDPAARGGRHLEVVAPHLLRQHGEEVAALVTTMVQGEDRVTMHGTRRAVVRQQAVRRKACGQSSRVSGESRISRVARWSCPSGSVHVKAHT